MSQVLNIQQNTVFRRKKTRVIRARCADQLAESLQRVAIMKDVDISDIIRDACRSYVLDFERRVTA